MDSALLEVRGVSKAFQGVRALREVSFDLRRGEAHALLGENGAGKSTLIKVITGAHSPDQGEILVQGVVCHKLDPRAAHRLGIFAIYQQPALFPELSVAENIALAIEPPSAFARVRWEWRRSQAVALLARVGARIEPDALVSELSMPEQQLVEIAKALGAGARVLVMDEPTASLTPEEVSTLIQLIRALKSEGVGVIYISHRLEEVFQLADRITVLRDGVSLGTWPKGELTPGELIRKMVGRDLSVEFPPAGLRIGRVRLEARGLGCQGSGVHGVNLTVRAGEVVGVSGLVGAGRTELARVLFGVTPADSGEIWVDGSPRSIQCPGDAVRAGLCYLPEDRRRHGVVGEMSLIANTSMAVLSQLFQSGWILEGVERRLAMRFVDELSIKCDGPEALAGSLSGGNQQKVALARWLAADPGVLVLDEPTQGVDVGAKSEIHRIIRALADRGLAVLMISSDLPEIMGLSDRILVMRGGRVVEAMARSAATSERVMASAMGGGGLMA